VLFLKTFSQSIHTPSMNSSCVNVDEYLILSFFIIGCLLTIIGILLNLCLCLLFCRAKSLYRTPYGIFIIALSIADIVKLIAEYLVHLVYFFNQHPYFVCSITWFLTMTSENLSYAFLCALGKKKNFIFKLNFQFFFSKVLNVI
jgi:hypothetical protein